MMEPARILGNVTRGLVKSSRTGWEHYYSAAHMMTVLRSKQEGDHMAHNPPFVSFNFPGIGSASFCRETRAV
jgi:hypothetical protein